MIRRSFLLVAPLLFAAASAAPPPSGKFVIVGMGTDADLMTLRAQKTAAEADILLAEEGLFPTLWPQLAKGKQVWEYPHALRKFYGANPETLKNPAQRAEAVQLDRLRKDLAARITTAVRAGKTVANLQGGDPMIYGMTLFLEMLPADIPTSIVPGVGSFQAASAALKKSPPYGHDTSGVILTMDDWPGRVDINEKLMAAGSTLVFYTMNLEYPRLFEQLKRHYPAGTPVAVICDAGHPENEKIVRSTVGAFLSQVDYRKLPVNRHILFVGKFLEAGQARKDYTPRITEASELH